MAQKVDVKENLKTPPPAKFEKIVQEIPQNIEGVKPFIEEPEAVIKKAIKKSIILISLVSLITAGAIFYGHREISKMTQNLQNKQNLIYLANRQVQMSTELEKEWTNIFPNIAKIEAVLPPSTDLLGFMGELEKIAQASGVQQTIKFQTQTVPTNLPDQTKSQKKGSSVDYSVELKGNLDQINNYLLGVEKAPYFTKVITANFTGGLGMEKEATGTLEMKVFTYP